MRRPLLGPGVTRLNQLAVAVVCLPTLAAVGVFVGTWAGSYVMPDQISATLSLFVGLLSITLVALQSVAVPCMTGTLKHACRAGWPCGLMALAASLVLATSTNGVPKQQCQGEDRIVGLIPYSDGCGYYRQVLAWPAPSFDEWNSRRSWNAAINISAASIGDSTVGGMHVVRIAIAALSITAFAAAVAASVGWIGAMLCASVLIYWTYPYATSCLSELNGITVSAAASAVFVSAVRRRSWPWFCVSLIGLSLAYAIRPYNPLWVMLAAAGGSAWLLVGAVPRRIAIGLGIGVVALVAGWFVQQAPYWAYGNPSGAINANAADVALGLARGTNWKEASIYFHQQSQFLYSSGDESSQKWSLAVKTALANPKPLLKAMTVSLVKCAYKVPQEFGAAYGLPLRFGKGIDSAGAFIRHLANSPTIWVCGVLFCGAIAASLRALRGTSLVLLSALGLVALFSFAPIVFTDGGFRVAATLYPPLSIIALGLPLWIGGALAGWRGSSTQGRFSLERDDCEQEGRVGIMPVASTVALALGAAVLGAYPLALAGPGIFRSLDRPRPTGMTVTVEAGAATRWTGWNNGVTSHEALVAWADSQGLSDLSRVFAKDAIRSIVFDPVKTYRIAVDPQALTPEDVSVLRSALFEAESGAESSSQP